MSAQRKPAPEAVAPSTKGNYLSRDAAAAWLAKRGLDAITSLSLRNMAAKGKGPAYSRLGKLAYYTEEQLQAWLDAEIKPVTRSRAAPRRC